jgi:hypothetical protein
MDERYPYIRFVVDAAQIIAGAVGLIVLCSCTLSACHRGGLGGLIGFVVALIVAGIAYFVTMVQIEALRVLLDIESSARESAAALRRSAPVPPGVPPGPAA